MEKDGFGEGTCQNVRLDGWEEGSPAQETHREGRGLSKKGRQTKKAVCGLVWLFFLCCNKDTFKKKKRRQKPP